jgi:hypothetical protein
MYQEMLLRYIYIYIYLFIYMGCVKESMRLWYLVRRAHFSADYLLLWNTKELFLELVSLYFIESTNASVYVNNGNHLIKVKEFFCMFILSNTFKIKEMSN